MRVHPFLAAGQLRKVDSNSAIDPDKVEETVLINSNTDRLLLSSNLPKDYPSIEGIVIDNSYPPDYLYFQKITNDDPRPTMTKSDD